MNLKGLPSEERPRERFIKYGRDNISNEELIEIILKSGTRKYGLKEISHNILSSVNNINELKNILDIDLPINKDLLHRNIMDNKVLYLDKIKKRI